MTWKTIHDSPFIANNRTKFVNFTPSFPLVFLFWGGERGRTGPLHPPFGNTDVLLQESKNNFAQKLIDFGIIKPWTFTKTRVTILQSFGGTSKPFNYLRKMQNLSMQANPIFPETSRLYLYTLKSKLKSNDNKLPPP